MYKQLFTTGLITAGLLLASATSVLAETCQPIYGGGQTCQNGNLEVVKSVKNPNTGEYLTSLGDNNTYGTEKDVPFKITVRNTGNAEITNVVVKDVLPPYITADAASLEQKIGTLKAGESRDVFITGRTASASAIPNNGTTCVTNQAVATADNQSQRVASSQVCIQKNVLGTTTGPVVYPAPKVVTTPPTGAEVFSLLGLIPAALVGRRLRKKSAN